MSLPYPMTPGGPAGPYGPVQPFPGPAAFPGAPPPVISTEQRAELREAWGSIVKRKWLILSLTAMVALVAYLVQQSMPPVYRAQVSMMLEGTSVGVPGLRDRVESVGPSGDYLATQLEVIRSRAVAERTARALKLWEHPAVDPRVSRPDWYDRVLESLGVRWKPTKSAAEWREDDLLSAATSAVRGGIGASPVTGTHIVNVSFTHANREVASMVANELAQQYIESVRSTRSTRTAESSRQLLERLGPLREQLARSEQALLDFRAKRGIVSMGGTGLSPGGQQLGGMTDRMMEVRAQRLALESAVAQIKSATSPEDYMRIPAVMRDAAMADLQRRLAVAKASRTALLETFTAESFRVRQVDDEITKLEVAVSAQAQVVAATLVSQFETTRSSEQALERSVGQIRGSLSGSNRDEFELAALERTLQRDREIFEAFMNRVKETGIVSEMTPPVARVLDPARGASQIPSGKENLVQMAALMTLLLASLGAIFIDRLDSSLKGIADTEARLKQHVLAALPQRQREQRAALARTFVDEPQSSFAEGIRTARTGVALSSLDVDRKILLVTSSVPGEGKTTVAINMALAHAQTQSTLLIDGDLRRSRVGRSLGLDPGLKGLTDLVAGTASVNECVTLIKDTGLLVLPVGKIPPNPLELLMSRRFQDVLKMLSQQFEVIVIDSSPVELVSDALVLAPQVTSIAYVVRAMKTPAPLVRKCIGRLQRAGGNVLGVVLNRLDFKASQRYHGEYGMGDELYDGYGYGKSYGYGYGYGSSSSKRKKKRKPGPNDNPVTIVDELPPDMNPRDSMHLMSEQELKSTADEQPRDSVVDIDSRTEVVDSLADTNASAESTATADAAASTPVDAIVIEGDVRTVHDTHGADDHPGSSRRDDDLPQARRA
jgi:succinoglycan biosynthesis transport protein ExoP